MLALSLAFGPRPSEASLFPDSAFSNDAAGTTGAAFLKVPAGARAQALGGTCAAAADDSEALFWNPSGLAHMEESGRSEVSFSYNALLETSYQGTLAYSRPLSRGRGVFAAAFVYFSQSSIQGYDTLGNRTDGFTPNDLAFVGGYAKKLGSVHLGGSLKVIRSSVGDASGTSFAADFGVQGKRVTDLGEGALDLGASVRNLGPAIPTGSVADPLPFELQLGALWHIGPRVRFMLDGHIPVDHDPYPSLGLEASLGLGDAGKGSIRAGYNLRDKDDIDGLTGLRAGFGLDIRRFRFDYAWVPFGDLGTTHRISGALRF